ncbi:MAG: ArnT family glycosyltransferase [Candidatus Hodarchaeales archaeon]
MIAPVSKRERLKDYFLSARFAILVFALSFFLKLWETSSIRMWDEGWYADIAARMAGTMDNGGDWAYPIYMEFGVLRVFDKPPLLFWVTGLLINLLGRSTLALKLPIAFSGAMLAAIAYFLYSGDRDDRTVGALAGLMMAAAYFVNFYSRTAYIDITMVFLSSLVVLFAKRAIDAVIDNDDLAQGLIFLLLTGIANALNLLLKAWQGLIVGPALGIYLFMKIYQREVDTAQTIDTIAKLSNPKRLKQAVMLFPRNSRRNHILTALIAFVLPFIFLVSISEGVLIGLLLVIPTSTVLFAILEPADFPEENSVSLFDLALIGTVLGILASFTLYFLVGLIEPYYQVLEDLAHGMGDSGGGYAILYLGLPEELFGKSSKEQLGDFLLGIFSILPILIVVITLSAIIACFAVIGLAVLGEPNYRAIVKDNLPPLIPTLLLGLFLLFWATQIMLGGMFFNHDPISTVLFGLAGALFILTALGVFNALYRSQLRSSAVEPNGAFEEYSDLLRCVGISFGSAIIVLAVSVISFLLWYNIFNWNPWFGVIIGITAVIMFLTVLVVIQKKDSTSRFQKILRTANPRIFFTGFVVIVATLSFLPFLGWLDYVARNMSKLSYLDPNRPVRRPGELPEDVYSEHKDDILRWFFFEYYIGWRYDNPSPNEGYDMWNAIHSAFADPIFVAMIPIFFIGIYAFFRTKKAADGLLYTTWFFSTLLVFLPAAFQLNYYYLACFLPFYLVVAKGIVFMFHKARPWWGFEYLAVTIAVLTLGFILHHYLIITYDFLSIPLLGITAQIAPSGPHLGRLDLAVLSIGILASSILLFWIRKDLNIMGLSLVFVVVLSSLIAISYSVEASKKWDPRFEEIGNFILEHEGDHDQSTWVFSDAGTEYALRYYLGYEIFAEGGRWVTGQYIVPFTDNSSSRMETFVSGFPQIKFWIVLNDTFRDHDTREETQAYYSEAFFWLKENYVCVDDRIGIPEWLAYHVYADPSVL